MNYLFKGRYAFDSFMRRGWALAVQGDQRNFNFSDGLASFEFDQIALADGVVYWNQQQRINISAASLVKSFPLDFVPLDDAHDAELASRCCHDAQQAMIQANGPDETVHDIE